MSKVMGGVITAIIYFILALFFSNTVDSDGLLVRESVKIYDVIVKFFQFPSNLLILFNIGFISFLMKDIYRENKILFILLLFNPFIILNVLDAYNQFVFIIFTMYFVEIILRYQGYSLLLLVLFFTNPAYMVNSFNQLTLNSSKVVFGFLLTLLLILSIYLLYEDFIVDTITNNPKYILLSEHGLDLIESSAGSFRVDQRHLDSTVINVLLRFSAVFFPIIVLEVVDILTFFISIYSLVAFFFIFKTLKSDVRILITIVIYILMLVLFISNMAVIYRHLFPFLIFYIFFIINNKSTLTTNLPSKLQRNKL